MAFGYSVEIASAGSDQDRATVLVRPDGLVIALADGAGGTSHGALAAQAIVDMVCTAESDDWVAVLEALDGDVGRLGHGQSTAVIVAIDARGIAGCSVGDSGAWVIRDDVVELTRHQIRKPLVGAGCTPIPFRAGPLGAGTLLVASDGLLRYAKPQDIARLARGPDLVEAARALVDLVRLPTGALQDDVAVVLCPELA